MGATPYTGKEVASSHLDACKEMCDGGDMFLFQVSLGFVMIVMHEV